MGSTLIMLTSIHIFDVYYTLTPCDPARIAAGVITGIGFLGAGAIMHFKSAVRGLTTAASLWVVAGIGLAVGSGLYWGATVTTVLTMVVLMLFSKLEHAMIRKDWYKTIIIETKDGMEQLRRIRDVLSEHRTEITDFEVERSKDNTDMILRIGLKLYEMRYAGQIISDIGHLEGVGHVKWDVE
jgi:putative Mg2+ transporter-C (MgtC) family protein